MNWSGRFWLLFSVYLLSLTIWQYTSIGSFDRNQSTEISSLDDVGTISQNTDHLPTTNFISNQRPALSLTIKIQTNFWWNFPAFNHSRELVNSHLTAILYHVAPLTLSLAIKMIIFPFHSFH